MPLPYDLTEALSRAMSSEISDLWTCFPGSVVSFDPDSCTARIRPTVRRTVPDDATDGLTDLPEDLPDLPDVPILYAQAAVGQIRFPLAPGDTVLVCALTLDATKWRLTGEVPSDPADAARMHIKSCVAIPGFVPDVNATPLTVANGIEVTSSGPVVVTAGTPHAVKLSADSVKLEGATVRAGLAGAPSTSELNVFGNTVRLGLDDTTDTDDVPVALSTLVRTEMASLRDAIATGSPITASVTGGGGGSVTFTIPGHSHGIGAVGASRVTAK